MEFIRADPLEAEVRRRIADALRRVSGVTSVDEQDREQWSVTGTPSGEALVRAAAEVVDDLEDRIRAFMYGGDG
jgi:cephalosporin-C deacetylase-like acetyl esterase